MTEEIPDQILVTVPEPIDGSYDSLKVLLWEQYHLDLETDPDSDNYLDLFYNSDQRSFCGWSEDFNQIRLFPEYYAKGWEDTYWKALKDEASDFQVIHPSVKGDK